MIPLASDQLYALGDQFADAWLGVPFQWDGRDPGGVDCWGLVWLFHFHVLGQIMPDWRRGDHGRAWIAATIAGEQLQHWRALPRPHDGCITVAKAAAPKRSDGTPRALPRHVGIFWRGSILHAAEGKGVVLERLAEFTLRNPAHEFGEYVP